MLEAILSFMSGCLYILISVASIVGTFVLLVVGLALLQWAFWSVVNFFVGEKCVHQKRHPWKCKHCNKKKSCCGESEKS